jgi:hypothetical protein
LRGQGEELHRGGEHRELHHQCAGHPPGPSPAQLARIIFKLYSDLKYPEEIFATDTNVPEHEQVYGIFAMITLLQRQYQALLARLLSQM